MDESTEKDHERDSLTNTSTSIDENSKSKSESKQDELGSSASTLTRHLRSWFVNATSKIHTSARKSEEVPVVVNEANSFDATTQKEVSRAPAQEDVVIGESEVKASCLEDDTNVLSDASTSWLASALTATGVQAESVANGVRETLSKSLITAIRAIAAERDRDEVIRWFVNARTVLSRTDASKSEMASELYKSVNAIRVGKLVTNIAATSLSNYKSSNLPLALKVALPVTAIGAAVVGSQGAGIVAMGSAFGAPVLLLLFLGTAGVTSVLEAFIRDRSIRDPLTQLLLTFVAFEQSRRARKELLDAMRADALTPKRAPVPENVSEELDFLFQMDPVAFERHVMSYFATWGHPTGMTPRSNDFGVDGYVFHPDGIVVVQCKRYAIDNPVGRPSIQQFKGVIEEQKAYRGYFVTTSRFTQEAIESAAKSERIVLVDRQKLHDWHTIGFDQQ